MLHTAQVEWVFSRVNLSMKQRAAAEDIPLIDKGFGASLPQSKEWVAALGVQYIDFGALREALVALACFAIKNPFTSMAEKLGDFCHSFLFPNVDIIRQMISLSARV